MSGSVNFQFMENIGGFLAGDKCMYIGQFLELLTERVERVN